MHQQAQQQPAQGPDPEIASFAQDWVSKNSWYNPNGTDEASKIVLATFVVFFLVFYNTYAGVRDVDHELVDPDDDVDWHRERVVEAALNAGRRQPTQANSQELGLKVGDDVVCLEDNCSHAFCSLSDGDVEDDNVICPCHGAAFDARSGKPTTGPAVAPVKTFPVTISGSDVVVSI